MRYAVEIGSGDMTYIPSFVKTGSDIQKLVAGATQKHRQHGDRISLLFLNKESRLKTPVRFLPTFHHRLFYTRKMEIKMCLKIGIYVCLPDYTGFRKTVHGVLCSFLRVCLNSGRPTSSVLTWFRFCIPSCSSSNDNEGSPILRPLKRRGCPI
jgi:hypothetical protein